MSEEYQTPFAHQAEVDHLEGDPSKGRRILGWELKTDVRGLAAMMVDSDFNLAQKERMLKEAGHTEISRAGF
jgi:GDPmannose 4,6-dehydratase